MLTLYAHQENKCTAYYIKNPKLILAVYKFLAVSFMFYAIVYLAWIHTAESKKKSTKSSL